MKTLTSLNLSTSELQALIYEHKVLVIKKSDLTETSFIELASSMGELIPFVDKSFHHPTHPEIFVVSNRIDEKGEKVGMDKVGRYWHSDGSFLKEPQPLSLLWCRTPAELGGETDFLDMQLMWEDLPSSDKAHLEKAFGVHDGLFKYIICQDDLGLSLEEVIKRDRKICPPILHPAVITHPVTGLKSLYINPGFTTTLVNGDAEIFATLMQNILDAQETYRHQWEVDDLVIWDNRSVLHRAQAPVSGEREMYRLGVRDGAFYA